ncbi:DUF7344 domain-containing protein [Natrarchaeobius oligotrophus]|uniref:DUF7344 domain-containing protein n=1 Tax=Natrarchaeobius chitinivorans TaxID=1679083 RepID=A0A3N6MZA7_NATCH|nr:hypothetical protein [Natrarchaeobius chitinivorans]RQH03481.1 hypothetical protein EA472_02695 [Natrarchaeobius chitinivorans]
MSSPPGDESSTTVAFDVLSSPVRRQLVSALLERAESTDSRTDVESTSIDELTTDVASAHHGHPIVTDDQWSQTRVSLVHAHLPRLEERGLLACEPGGDGITVALEDHPLLEIGWVRTLLADPTGGSIREEGVLNRTLDSLRPPRGRTTCAALAKRRDAVPVVDLAAMVAATEADADTRLVDVSETDCRAVATTLAHRHLPALANAGVLEYDRDDETAAIDPAAPQWRADWLLDSPLGSVAKQLRPALDESGDRSAGGGVGRRTNGVPPSVGETECRTIDGAVNVVAHSQEIVDDADEELFVMAPDDDVFQPGCLERWRAAAERGVDIYVGSHSPRLRDTVRATVPDATVCKPQFDWINVPVENIHHGRVVFADRQRAMVVTIDESRGDRRVTAITGTGEENALVRLVREHVGPRLDRLHGGGEQTSLLPM